jgi:hypothetical protein
MAHLHEALESMIDDNGIAAVLSALFEVCHDKADHVESAWQDYPLGSAWRRLARKIDAAESTVAQYYL